MSAKGKKPNKTFEKKVSVSSLGTPDKDGFLTKQGGSYKNWKRRWFVLKGDTLYYFKTQKDTEQTGQIKIEKNSLCSPEQGMRTGKKSKFYFSVGTASRTFFLFAETDETMKQWVERISRSIETLNGGGSSSAPSPSISSSGGPAGGSTPVSPVASTPAVGGGESSSPPAANHSHDSPEKDRNIVDAAPIKDDSFNKEEGVRARINRAKTVIPFLQDEESKVLEFWEIWSESIPPREDLQPGMAIEFHVSTSANMQKLTWRTAGPQNIFIQKMVDFFWNVGAPESEIDKLNEIGADINPIKIGSWIDMSAKGGMDGGWYFPVDIPLKQAIEAADDGEPSRIVNEWAEKHGVDKSYSVGRDMGAAPPRQTEIRMRLPGSDFQTQLKIGLDAFTAFDFPPLPTNALSILQEATEPGICMSVITSSEGFVRLGLLVPKPSQDTVKKLCSISGANYEDLFEFENSLGSSGPYFAEYQFLKEGFGYGVYKEGFDIVFHFLVGTETID
mmetsp:Transcript_18258/g.30448  ORF Transcript_18258/g.30448 Transcript_18258/m.30448 type:complete len:502 (-) Transcript_18258:267-1772(-)|eukprot:CAMPEP_0184336574 /NCGR_PEP_ID=MMETSP1089-20130417/4816_1 /TAXON_ID=38269 ORGANISM="Gloeochaete wittrockiana, Strain SAG46.84" /NCGR_SAMPLE_ID=MMETSP1089 /ASSEMBLY_ACC=CAM_ASM_000445 /LENGTH=501 /DNA_ID=CAMNT_0026661623 /DNA_START=84 /DNA_END=1589 /DNA_ORIENTATION=+